MDVNSYPAPTVSDTSRTMFTPGGSIPVSSTSHGGPRYTQYIPRSSVAAESSHLPTAPARHLDSDTRNTLQYRHPVNSQNIIVERWHPYTWSGPAHGRASRPPPPDASTTSVDNIRLERYWGGTPVLDVSSEILPYVGDCDRFYIDLIGGLGTDGCVLFV